MMQPKWFIQTADKSLHGYLTLEILLIDLNRNRYEEITILEAVRGFTIRYEVTTEAALLKQADEYDARTL